jgi:hypothetical protein
MSLTGSIYYFENLILIKNDGENVKKIMTLSALVITGLLAGCSGDDAVKQQNKTSESSTTASKSFFSTDSDINEGIWSFCNDKQLTASTVVENCKNIDAAVWQIEAGELTALVVDTASLATPEVECITDCFAVASESIKTSEVAKGYYEVDELGYTFTIVESKDETKYPLCSVRWDFKNRIADDLVQWTFDDLNCDMGNVAFTGWAKKYPGEVN